MKTKIAPPKKILKESTLELKKYSGIDAALLNLGIKINHQKSTK
jgi:hypothetical protein